MTTELTPELLERIRGLSASDKEIVRDILSDNTPVGDPELKALLTRRWEDYQSGKVQAIDLDDYLSELDRRIAEGGKS